MSDKDNEIINKGASYSNQLRIDNKEFTGLGIQKIIVGTQTTETDFKGDLITETIQDEQGINRSRVAVVPKEIYRLSSQNHHPWFILALETGRGTDPVTGYPKSWFPGSKVMGYVEQARLKAGPGDSYEDIGQITNAMVDVLEITRINQEPINEGWYKIKYSNEGYIKKTEITNLHYEENTNI